MKKAPKSRLALLGGMPILKRPFSAVHNIGARELRAVTNVIKKGPLSGFVGAPGPYFLGGPAVLSFEKKFKEAFKIRHAVSFSSATTALHAAIVALGIGPGDEVIVPPYTMSASATAILMNGAVPIFADIDPKTFCIDPKEVEKKITKRTKAIMVVNLFGQPADFGTLLPLAKKHNLKIIEDNAQAAGATWNGKYAGTIGDIGVFSFNIHKSIQSGEGGVLVTNDNTYALRAQLCRNHGEGVTEGLPHNTGGPIFGSNYRMPEVCAAIAEVQLSRLGIFNARRTSLTHYLTSRLVKIPGITVPVVRPKNTHVYYVYPILIDEKKLGISRDRLADAMAAEGFPLSKGYVKPTYLLPVFQEKKAFNATHFPFDYKGMTQDYRKGSCPVTERLWEKDLTLVTICQYPYTTKEVDLFLAALNKVLSHKEELA